MTWLYFAVGGLTVACVILASALIMSLYYNLKFARIILGVEDAIDESLDILDEKYTVLAQIAEKDIFFDSPEVRQAVASIQGCQVAVLSVANSLASIDKTAVEESDNTGSA